MTIKEVLDTLPMHMRLYAMLLILDGGDVQGFLAMYGIRDCGGMR
jgi:hypothetical protein